MISRRKIFGWLTGMAAGAAALPSAASARFRVVADADQAGAEFAKWQKWFRDHPGLLWSSADRNKVEQLAMRAQELAQPFIAANQQPNTVFDLDAWVDICTDNVLLKSYKRLNVDKPIGQRGPEIGLGMAITRKAIRDLTADEMDAEIMQAWTALVAATNQNPIPADYRTSEGGARMIMTLADIKANG